MKFVVAVVDGNYPELLRRVADTWRRVGWWQRSHRF